LGIADVGLVPGTFLTCRALTGITSRPSSGTKEEVVRLRLPVHAGGLHHHQAHPAAIRWSRSAGPPSRPRPTSRRPVSTRPAAPAVSAGVTAAGRAHPHSTWVDATWVSDLQPLVGFVWFCSPISWPMNRPINPVHVPPAAPPKSHRRRRPQLSSSGVPAHGGPTDSRSEPVGADSRADSRTAPDRVSAVQRPFRLRVAGEGFEPS
jgi:hypothetical protein